MSDHRAVEAEKNIDLLVGLREQPERAVAADDLLRLTREELHADLVFPKTKGGRLLADYSAIELPFPATDSLRIPERCPVDFSAFWLLSEHYRGAKGADTTSLWTYRWFYIEILCAEGKLKPRLWARWEAIEAGLPLRDISLEGSELDSDEVRLYIRQWWTNHGDEMLARRLVFEHVDRPWLDYLEFDQHLLSTQDEDLPIAPIAMSAFPIYLWPEDGATLAREMRNDLFRTSIFYPEKSENMRKIKFQELRDRFALKLRREGWGAVSGTRATIDARDKAIYDLRKSGKPIYRIAQQLGKDEKYVYDALYRYRSRHPEQK